MSEYLAARPIADPIHLFDCVMPCAGAEAFLVMREERARDLGLPHALVRGAIERHNAYSDDPVMVRGGWRVGSGRPLRAGGRHLRRRRTSCRPTTTTR